MIDDRFALRAQLGAGGFGEVWRAEDLDTGEAVALKILHPDLGADDRVVARFEREVAVLQAIEHDHLVRVVAARTSGPPHYLAMPIVPGVTLKAEMLRRAAEGLSFSAAEIVRFARQTAAALDAVHEHDVVHRDLKPMNVMVTTSGGALDHACVLDLGIARIDVDASDQTTVGRTLGTLMYMPPEQIRGEVVDRRADVFALGVVLFELATLTRPFARSASGQPYPLADGPFPSAGLNAPAEVIRRIVFEARPKVRHLGGVFGAAIARALSAKPSDRFDSCGALADAVADALEGAPPPPKPRAETMELVDADEDTPLTSVMPRDLTRPAVVVAEEPKPTPEPTRRATSPVVAAAILGFALAVAVAAFLVVGDQRPPPAEPQPPPPTDAPSPRVVVSERPPPPAPAPPPARDGGVATKKRARPRPAPPPAPPPPVAADPFEFDPNDTASVVRAARRLERAAATIEDPDRRTSIRRCASLAAMRASARELEACLARYRR